jgi:hypothetical protein
MVAAYQQVQLARLSPSYSLHPSIPPPPLLTATCDLRAQQPAIALPARFCTLLDDGVLPVQRLPVKTQALRYAAPDCDCMSWE